MRVFDQRRERAREWKEGSLELLVGVLVLVLWRCSEWVPVQMWKQAGYIGLVPRPSQDPGRS
jgi:hypothetical protein